MREIKIDEALTVTAFVTLAASEGDMNALDSYSTEYLENVARVVERWRSQGGIESTHAARQRQGYTLKVSDLIKRLADWSPDTEVEILTPAGPLEIGSVVYGEDEENWQKDGLMKPDTLYLVIYEGT